MIELHICDVCRILDSDITPKICFYCNQCDAWICEADNKNWNRRIRAALKRRLEPGYKGALDYVGKLAEQIARKENPTAF